MLVNTVKRSGAICAVETVDNVKGLIATACGRILPFRGLQLAEPDCPDCIRRLKELERKP